MPRGDGTGPTGAGPMSGRAAGLCRGNPLPGYATSGPWGRAAWAGPGFGRGWPGGFGRTGFGRGWPGGPGGPGGYGWRAAFAAPAGEREILERQAQLLKRRLNAVDKRLAELPDAAGDDKDESGKGTPSETE